MDSQIWIDNNQQWQAKIWIDTKDDTPTTVYGRSIAMLESEIEQKILTSNAHESIVTTRGSYLYSDGTTQFPESNEMLRSRNEEKIKYVTYKEGWHVNRYNALPQYMPIGTLDQLVKEILLTPIFEKGPHYKDPTIINGTFLLSMIQVTKLIDVDVSSQVNHHLQRGWHILHIDDKFYHLGHEDPDAL